MPRILISALVSGALSGLFGFLLLPVLRALKAGQSIREIGPTWHNYKAGTPMMGGLMFIFASVVCLLINIPFMEDYTVFFVLILSLCFGLVGFVDDFCKLKKKQNMGLNSLQKALLQMAVSALFLYLMYATEAIKVEDGMIPLYIPFFDVSFKLHPLLYIFFAMFVMVGCDNAVNLTDGVDGLSDCLPVLQLASRQGVYGRYRQPVSGRRGCGYVLCAGYASDFDSGRLCVHLRDALCDSAGGLFQTDPWQAYF